MSKKLRENKAFLNLLLSADRKDAREILNSANKIQLQILAEIFYNIGILPRKLSKKYVNIDLSYINIYIILKKEVFW